MCDIFQAERDTLEQKFMRMALGKSGKECTELTAAAFRKAWKKTTEWTELVQGLAVKKGPGFFYRRYWKPQNRKAGIVLQ